MYIHTHKEYCTCLYVLDNAGTHRCGLTCQLFTRWKETRVRRRRLGGEPYYFETTAIVVVVTVVSSGSSSSSSSSSSRGY